LIAFSPKACELFLRLRGKEEVSACVPSRARENKVQSTLQAKQLALF